MRISSFQIENYKSYRETEKINLSPGFNVVVAPNNVGKTALLEILSCKFASKPHRNIKISRSQPLNTESSITLTFSMTGQEFKRVAISVQGNPLFLPMPPEWSGQEREATRLLDAIFSLQELHIVFKCTNQNLIQVLEIKSKNYKYIIIDQSCRVCIFNINMGTDNFVFHSQSNTDKSNVVFVPVVQNICQGIYKFLAERQNIGMCSFGSNNVLNPNATNLAEVIDILQSNPEKFSKFNSHVSSVFENVKLVVSRPSLKNKSCVEIVVWTVDPASERDDLAMELSESGTGIGQVLAMLYVALTSTEPRIIIIDEPNTYLHPGAAKKLVQILKQYPQHQYIFATHSPDIIRVSEPGTVISVRWEDGESKLVPINARKIEDLQAVLMDVGVKLSDVFGADTVLWVEGITEEVCFDAILRRLGKFPYLGVSVLAVRSIGEFESKRVNVTGIWDIYRTLTTAHALLPPAIAFVFDREGRTEKEMTDVSRSSKGKVWFLPRRTYENYLIHPLAITALLNTLPTFSKSAIVEAKVRDWLLENGEKKDYCAENLDIGRLENQDWLTKVHGAKLLAHMVRDLSAKKEEFRKRSHSLQLTEWLIENDPDCLKELVDFLSELLPKE